MGNVLFTENVAEFYQLRLLYKTSVCDSVANEIAVKNPITTLKGILDYNYLLYALTSSTILDDMRNLYAQGKQMMEVSDKEIEAYRDERKLMDKGVCRDESADTIVNSIIQLQMSIDEAKAKLK